MTLTPLASAHLALRVGLAFSFLYPPIAALRDPISWASYFPPFVREIADPILLLHVFGVIEVIIALWILSGWRIRIPCLIACALLVGIVLVNFNQFDVLFRDLSIAAMALALALWPEPNEPVLQKEARNA
jgi:uncharacterized membrane protein YphA (DoxX/SURF4 family)